MIEYNHLSDPVVTFSCESHDLVYGKFGDLWYETCMNDNCFYSNPVSPIKALALEIERRRPK